MRKIKKKAKPPVTHQQWVEVRVVNGETVSTFYPTNEEFEKERLELDPPATLIYRRLNFVNGVPKEYAWTQPPPQVAQYGGHFLHRMKVEDWQHVLETERAQGNHRVVPSQNPQTRPESLGPCPCAACTKEREST